MAFGKCLRRERERQDMTLTELARRVEVSIAYPPYNEAAAGQARRRTLALLRDRLA